MKRIVLILLASVCLAGCSAVVDQAQKIDQSMATYLGKERLSLNCQAGIAQADLDMASDAVPVSRIKAIQKYADPESQDYRDCYAGYAWLGYVGSKAEGAMKSIIKKLVELGILE